MSRSFALTIALIAAAVFAVIYFWPEAAGAEPRARVGMRSPSASGVSVTGRLHLGDGAVGLDARIGDAARRGHAPGPRHRWHRRRDRHHGQRPVLVVPHAAPRERVIVRETVVPPPPVPVAPPEPPPAPLDPRGHARTLPARGAVQHREWVLGEVLPGDIPHVALEAAAFGLPQPPAGQIYARVDRDVLRIDADTRRIVAVVAR